MSLLSQFRLRGRRARGAFAVFAGLVAASCFLSLPSSPRLNAAERTPFVDDWKFRRGDADEPAWRLTWRNVEPFALSTRGELLPPGERTRKTWGAPGLGVATIRPDFDDSDWETVDLPRDAAIGEPFSYRNEPTQSLLPTSDVVWYRKSFDLPADAAGKTIAFDFDGAMARSAVWVNGNFAGGWGYGYSSFRVDATPFVKFGGRNVVVVRCANPAQSSRWYTGNGLYRNVWLVASNDVRVARWGVCVRTSAVDSEPGAEFGNATLNVSVDVERAALPNVGKNATDADKAPVDATVSVEFFRRDAAGKRIGDEPLAKTAEKTVAVEPGKNVKVEFNDFAFANAPLWSPDFPNTLLARTTVSVAGKILDVDETPCGVRELRYDANDGLFVNGKKYRLRGFCLHHDLGALGAAYNEQAEKRRLLALKSIGCNAIRLSHNPSAPETVDQLARLGFLVQAESFDQWRRPQGGSWRAAGYCDLFENWSEADLRSLVRRDRNCPAIVMWSIGNEIPELTDEPAFVADAKRLVAFVREEDPTRPATSACNAKSAGFGEIPNVLDVFGYNYYGRAGYAEFHFKNPTVPVYGSEVVCVVSSRDQYAFPRITASTKIAEGQVDFRNSGYGWNAFGFDPAKPLAGWACPPDFEFEAQDRNPFVLGGFAWTGIDYLGAAYHIDEMARSQNFVDPDVAARAEAEKKELGVWRVPSRICETGAFDSALFPKNLAYLYKSRWLPDVKTTRILPHWNWPNRIGETTPVEVYTSGDAAELFLNGKSQGRREKAEFQYRLVWEDVKYEPGELRAIVYKDGEVWDEAIVETTGEPAALRLRVELPDGAAALTANGRDLAFATLEVVDAEGRVVPTAALEVEFKLENADAPNANAQGDAANVPGTLVATDSGDACDLTPYNSPRRKTFGGLTTAIIRSKRGVPGTLKLTATADGLPSASVEIESK